LCKTACREEQGGEKSLYDVYRFWESVWQTAERSFRVGVNENKNSKSYINMVEDMYIYIYVIDRWIKEYSIHYIDVVIKWRIR